MEGRPVAPTNHWRTVGIAQGASMFSGSSRQRESHGQTRSDMWKNLEDSRGCSCGIALDGHVGQAYNEEALHYFLHIERKRGESSTRPPWLAVVELKTPSGIDVRIDAGLAGKLFAIMATCLRETDFMGWYRADGAVAAVLPQRAGAPRDVAPVVGERIAEALRARIPAEAGRLRGAGVSAPARLRPIAFACLWNRIQRKSELPVATETTSMSARLLDPIGTEAFEPGLPASSRRRYVVGRPAIEGTAVRAYAATKPRLHVLNELLFQGALLRERRTADRTNQPFGLLLVRCDGQSDPASLTWEAIIDARSLREARHRRNRLVRRPNRARRAPVRDRRSGRRLAEETERRVRGELACRLGPATASGCPSDCMFTVSQLNGGRHARG